MTQPSIRSKAEAIASQELRAILAPLPIDAPIDPERLDKFQSALEFFLPVELGLSHESFDAFRFAVARKVKPDEAEFVGLALLISDQAWTPIHLWLRVSPDSDQITALDCRVGERGEGAAGLLRIPYRSAIADEVLYNLPERVDSIDWVYRAARG
jgi:hypothetical protein